MADDQMPGGDASSEAHPPGKQSQPAPEPGIVDQVSSALEAAGETLNAPGRWIDAQAEHAGQAATEAIASRFNQAFGTGETHPSPAAAPGIIDQVSYAVDAAGDAAEAAVSAPGRWIDAQIDRAGQAATEAIVSHLDPGAPPMTDGLEGSVGLGASASLGSPTATNAGFGTGEIHRIPPPEPGLAGAPNHFGPIGGFEGGVDVDRGYGLGSGLGAAPAPSDSIFDHVPHDLPGANDPFDGIGTDQPISASLDPEPMHATPAPEPAAAPEPPPAPEPASPAPSYDPANQVPPC